MATLRWTGVPEADVAMVGARYDNKPDVHRGWLLARYGAVIASTQRHTNRQAHTANTPPQPAGSYKTIRANKSPSVFPVSWNSYFNFLNSTEDMRICNDSIAF